MTDNQYTLPHDGLLQKFTFAEGLSLLVLLIIAMPLKYLFDTPEAVKVVGWIHGALFVVLMLLIGRYCLSVKNRFLSLKVFIILFISALIPFGWIIADKRIFGQVKRV
jgi:integral membrane protein